MPLLMLPKGIYCPTCKRTDAVPVGRKRPTSGLRVRYFKCACGARFKSEERLKGVTKPAWNRNGSGPGPAA